MTAPRMLLLATLICVGCGPTRAPCSESPSSAAAAATVEDSARAFAVVVAHDVTNEGPTAWQRHFADSPSFFMAVDGSLVFPNRASATAAIQGLAHTIKHIELRWGDSLRVDVLGQDLAMVATTYHEVRESTDGGRVDESGFFTGIAERRDGRWQFRNAHWSVPVLPPPVR
jgi:hypothetical protein